MKTFKRAIILVVLFLLLIFNIIATGLYYGEGHGDYSIESHEVTIIDQYVIHGDAGSADSYYMTGRDDAGDKYTIMSHDAEIGDRITIYANPNSAEYNGGDRHWYTSEKRVRRMSSFATGMFALFTVVNILVIIGVILGIKKNKGERL